MISSRGLKTSTDVDYMGRYGEAASANSYDAEQNPQGIISLGLAENTLMKREIEEKLRHIFVFESRDHLKYFDVTGTRKAKMAVKGFLQRYFSQGREIKTENIYIMNGATVCMDALAYALCDPGEVVLCPTPVYNRTFIDLQQRFQVDVQPIHLTTRQDCSEQKDDFELHADMIEAKILELQKEGKTVKGFTLINPQNPTGVIYPKEVVLDLMKICKRYNLHVIMDEIYALTIIDEDAKFDSVLSFDSLPDPQRTHFVYGMSKDFCLAGAAMGFIYSQNKHLKSLFEHWCNYHSVASFVQDGIATLLSDFDWCDSFIETNVSRIRVNLKLVRNRLSVLKVPIHNSKATFFAWVDFSRFLYNQSEDGELELFNELMAGGVCISPGTKMFNQSPGWFRVMAAIDTEILQEGLTRIIRVLERRKTRKL